MKIVNFSVSKRITITMMTLIVIVGGFISFSKLGLDMLPDVEFPMVSVITTYVGASPEDIESTVTKTVEQTVASVSGVKSVQSTSMESVSMVMVEFESGTNLDFAAQDLRDRLAMFEDFFPEGVRTPLVVKFDISMLPVLFYGVISDKRPIHELTTYVEDNVAYRLERLDGVASIIVQSPEIREILVEVDRDALETSGVTLDQIINIIRYENLNMPGGRFIEDHKDYLIRTIAEFQSLSDIENLIVGASSTGKPIQLKQVATVLDTITEKRSIVRIQESDGIVMMVSKQSGANTVQVADAVKKELALIETTLPDDISLHVVMDQSRSIKQMISSTSRAAILGGILAMLMIYFFIRNIRPTIAVGIAIPISIVVTFIPIYMAGYTLNLLTLGGLALGVGMLVDNAIVVIENIFRHLEEGKSREQSARDGASEVGMAITASTLTTLAVFLPLALGTGIAGQLARGLSLSISFAILASLFVSLTIVPVIASIFFKPRTEVNYKKEFNQSWLVKLKEWYSKTLSIALMHRKKVLGTTGLALILSIVIIPFIGTEFMPAMDQGIAMMKVHLPTGSSLEETDRAVRQVEKILLEDESVVTVLSSVGVDETDRTSSAGDLGNAGTHEGMIMARLKSKADRKDSDKDFIETLREKIPEMKDVRVEQLDIASMMGGGGGAVQIKIMGRDIDMLKHISDQIVDIISNVEGVRDVKSSLEEAKPEYRITLNREEINRMGLASGHVASVINTSSYGKVATRFRLAGDETDVRVKFKSSDRNSLRDIQMINLSTPMNTQVPLMQISTIEEVQGPVKITHDNQSRSVLVSANIVDRDLGSIVKDIQKELKSLETNLPDGYFVEFGGQYEQMIDTFITLAQALLLALIFVYMVMASQFESLKHPFVIMFTIPLALIGVILGFLVSGVTISLPSFIGFIMLTGIVVNNGIVLVDYINQLRKRGEEVHTAIIQAAGTRLRPVLITAFTTISGMLPMAIGGTEGSEMRVPMAITVIGGLTIATVLTLYIVPIIYSLMDKISFKNNK